MNLVQLDLKLFLLLNHVAGRSKAGDFAITFFAQYVPYALITAFIFALFIVPGIEEHPMLVITTTLVSTLISRLGIGTPIRYIFKRQRPHKVHRVHNVLTEESFSFPSGHSLFFFAFSASVFFFSHIFGAAFLVASCLITLFRVVAGVHYPADIVAGMLIGIFSAFVTFVFITPLLQALIYS